MPSHPTRVVTLSEPTTDNALALGVTPIGVVSGRGQQTVPNYLLDRAGDIPILGSIGTPNLEAIGAAHPDLILVDGTSVKNNDTETLTALGQIAPVFFTTQSGGDWRETFALTADALGVPTRLTATRGVRPACRVGERSPEGRRLPRPDILGCALAGR